MSTQAPIAGTLTSSSHYERAAETAQAQTVDGFTVLAGLFVALAPWIMGFDGIFRLAINNLVVGLAVAVMGVGFAWAYDKTHRVSWVCPVLGAWTIAGLWLITGIQPSDVAVISNVVGGGAVMLFGLAAITVGLSQRTSA